MSQELILTDAGWDRVSYEQACTYFSKEDVDTWWAKVSENWEVVDILHEVGLDPALAEDAEDAGDAVAISGRAELSVWTDKEGNSRPNLSVLADEVATLKGRPRPRKPRAPWKVKPQEPLVEGIPFDDELPEFSDSPMHRLTDSHEEASTPNTPARNTPKKKRRNP